MLYGCNSRPDEVRVYIHLFIRRIMHNKGELTFLFTTSCRLSNSGPDARPCRILLRHPIAWHNTGDRGPTLPLVHALAVAQNDMKRG